MLSTGLSRLRGGSFQSRRLGVLMLPLRRAVDFGERNMRRLLESFGLLVLLAICGCNNDGSGSAAASSGGGWKDFEPEQAKFTIKMPGDPAPLPKPDASIANIWGSSAGNLSYSIRYNELFDPDTAKDQDKIEGIFDDIYSSIGIKEQLDDRVQKRQINFGGIAGREIDGTTPDKKSTRIRMCVSGGRLYRADVTGPKEAVDSPDAEVFFNSFKVGR
jgi:hypothetical protein